MESDFGQPLVVDILAEDAERFDPEDKRADDDGFVRDFDVGTIKGKLEMLLEEEDAYQQALTRLRVWQKQPPERLRHCVLALAVRWSDRTR